MAVRAYRPPVSLETLFMIVLLFWDASRLRSIAICFRYIDNFAAGRCIPSGGPLGGPCLPAYVGSVHGYLLGSPGRSLRAGP